MPATPNNLSVLAYANDFTLWHYIDRTTDATDPAEGFYSPLQDQIHTGDVIHAVTLHPGGHATNAILGVTLNHKGVIVVKKLA